MRTIERVATTVVMAALWSQAAFAVCTGDCGGDGTVTVDEIVTGVNIALGQTPASECAAMDADGNGAVTVDELITSLNGALSGCPTNLATPTPTATATATTAATVATPTPCADSNGTADLQVGAAAPASGAGFFRVACVSAENAGGTRTELTRVTVIGSVQRAPVELNVYFVTDTGAIDTVTYRWGASAEIPGFYDYVVFCNGDACTNASMNLGSLRINLNGVPLSDGGAGSATVQGSITLRELPGSVPTPTPAGCPGGSLTMNLSEVQGVNTSSPLPATLVLGAAMNFSSAQPEPEIARFSASYEGCPSAFPRQALSFQFAGAPIVAGTSYMVSRFPLLNQIEFSEMGFSSTNAWEAASGQLVIDAVDASGVDFRIVDARMRPKFLETKGTFTLNAAGRLQGAVP